MPLVLSPKQINFRTLLPALTFTLGFIIVGAAGTERLASSLEWLLAFLSDNFGAFLLLFGLSILFIVIGLTFTRVGDLRLGGTNAKPDFSYSTWFASHSTAASARGFSSGPWASRSFTWRNLLPQPVLDLLRVKLRYLPWLKPLHIGHWFNMGFTRSALWWSASLLGTFTVR